MEEGNGAEREANGRVAAGVPSTAMGMGEDGSMVCFLSFVACGGDADEVPWFPAKCGGSSFSK